MTELERIIQKVNKDRDKQGKDPLVIQAKKLEPVFKIGTGIEQVDEALGGGISRGISTAIWGPPNCGKTSLCLTLARGVINSGGTVVWVDTENLKPEALEAFRVNIDSPNFFIIRNNDSAEEMIDTVNTMLFDEGTSKHRGLVDLIIIDSITNLPPDAENTALEKTGLAGSAQLARLPAMLARWTTQVTGRNMLGYGEKATALVLIAQQRANVGDQYNPTHMSGGHAVKHNPKVIAKVTRAGNTSKKDPKTQQLIPYSHDVIFEVTKNTSGGMPTKIRYTVIYGVGVDDTPSIYKKALDKGYIQKHPKSTFFYLTSSGVYKFVGKQADSMEILNHIPEIKDSLRNDIKGPRVTELFNPDESEVEIKTISFEVQASTDSEDPDQIEN